MYAEELKAGDNLQVGPDKHEIFMVDLECQPGRVYIEFTNGLTLSLKCGNEIINGSVIVLNPKKLPTEFAEAMRQRLEAAEKRFGSHVWRGSDPLAALEEELLDALVYLYVARVTRDASRR